MKNYISAEESGAGLRHYLRQISRVPLLTPNEEIELAGRIKKADDEARQRMIRANLRLVVKIAVNYVKLGLPLMDVIEEGNIGLMKAVDRFDPTKGAKLSTYAIWWIKQAIKSALHDQAKIIRLPRHSAAKLSKIRNISLQMSEALGREPTADELGEELGLDGRDIADLKTVAERPCSLDAPISDSDGDPLSALIGDEKGVTPFESLRDKDMHEKVAGALSVLCERERRIIFARFGLAGENERTLEEVGGELGVTRERARQLQNSALAKLRHTLMKQDESLAPLVALATA